MFEQIWAGQRPVSKTVVGNPSSNRRSAALLAALPHLLFATTMTLSTAFAGTAPSWLDAFGYGVLVITGIVLLLAWWRGWPLWSGGWAGYWLLIPYLWAMGRVPWRPGLDYMLALPPLAIGLFIFLRRPLYGLLTFVAPVLLMTRVFAFELELVVGQDWVWSGIWLLLALVTGAIVWLGSIRAGVLLIITFELVTGLILTVARSYLPYHGPPGMEMAPRATPATATLVNNFLPLTLAAITLPLALLLLRPLGRLARRGGPQGRRSHKLLLLGMAITFGGVFARRARPFSLGEIGGTVAAVAVVAGLLLSLGAAVALMRAVWSDGRPRWRQILLPLLAAFAPLVVFALPDPFVTAGRYSNSFEIQVTLSYVGVLLWTLLAIAILFGGGGRAAQAESVGQAAPAR